MTPAVKFSRNSPERHSGTSCGVPQPHARASVPYNVVLVPQVSVGLYSFDTEKVSYSMLLIFVLSSVSICRLSVLL